MTGRIKIAASMIIFGSVGIFVKNIPLSSMLIAFLRAVIAVLFLGIFLVVTNRAENKNSGLKKERLLPLLLSGGLLGLNWVLLFQAYSYSSVGSATLAYYFAPVFVLIFSPFILGEGLNKEKILCIVGSLVGLMMITDLSSLNSGQGISAIKGTLFALAAALLYASVVLSNKFIKGVSDLERTVVQMAAAALVLLPFVVADIVGDAQNFRHVMGEVNSIQWLLIIALGILHTGICYLMYFSGLKEVKAQSAAVISYLDPISAVVFAAIFLGERMTAPQLFGGGLILMFTYLSERTEK